MDADTGTQDPVEAPEPDEGGEDFGLPIFTLAEWATVLTDGRVCLGNAGLTYAAVPALPGGLPPLYLVALVEVPRSWAGQNLDVRVRALGPDGQPVANDPLAGGVVRLPAPGDSQQGPLPLPLALPLMGLPLREEGPHAFHLLVAGEDLGRRVLHIRRAAAPGA